MKMNLEKVFKNLVLLNFFVFIIMMVSIYFEPDDIALLMLENIFTAFILFLIFYLF